MKKVCLITVVFLVFAYNSDAALWKSREYRCAVNLPDGDPRILPWYTMGSVEPETLVGARRCDKQAFVYLGYADMRNKPKFRLNDKSVEELQSRFFGEGRAFRHSLQHVSTNGLTGIRLNGSQLFEGFNYGLVVDFYQVGGFVYEVAAMKENEDYPVQDPEIRQFLGSFRLIN